MYAAPALVITTIALSAIAAGCSSPPAPVGQSASPSPETPADEPAEPSPLPRGSEPVRLDPADFTLDIDNPYWPMPVGARWVYRDSDGEGNVQKVVVTVTDRTKTVAAGVRTRVVHDVVTENGRLVEDTYDWYAQDSAGNIWYLGEDTKEYEQGTVATTAGSWEAGVDGAQAGVIMPADPRPGLAYRQEYYAGEAEDNGAILSSEEVAQVPAGLFREVLMTRDTVPLEPRVAELKFYARGLGPVLAMQTSGGTSRESLVRVIGIG